MAIWQEAILYIRIRIKDVQLISCAPHGGFSVVVKVIMQRPSQCLQVKEGQRVVGIISVGDSLKYRITRKQL